MEKLIRKHAEALASELRKAKRQKKWRGDGHGNLIENRAVEDCVDVYCFSNGVAIAAEFGLDMYSDAGRAECACVRARMVALAMDIAKARPWAA